MPAWTKASVRNRTELIGLNRLKLLPLITANSSRRHVLIPELLMRLVLILLCLVGPDGKVKKLWKKIPKAADHHEKVLHALLQDA